MVDEPTIPDTIAILRGLKNAYESHHGVQITDDALIAAVTLSNRYITDRFCLIKLSTWSMKPVLELECK